MPVTLLPRLPPRQEPLLLQLDDFMYMYVLRRFSFFFFFSDMILFFPGFMTF